MKQTKVEGGAQNFAGRMNRFVFEMSYCESEAPTVNGHFVQSMECVLVL